MNRTAYPHAVIVEPPAWKMAWRLRGAFAVIWLAGVAAGIAIT